MTLLKRRSHPTDAAPEPTRAQASGRPGGSEPNPAGKGRPTPKRSQARAARAHGTALPSTPADKKEARARARAERRRKSQEYREAMLSGDVSKLPERERAPERVLARDFVDTRFNVGPYFLLIAAVYFVADSIGRSIANIYVERAAVYLMLIGILAVVVDSLLLARQVTKRVAAKYPNSHVRVRMYAAQRALLPRRWRMPRPRVSRGGAPPR
jgi:hypothetical protein